MDATEEKKDGEIKKTRRQQFEERMQTRYPDMDLADEEAFYGRINDDYDDYENKVGELNKEMDSFSNLFTSDPRSARLMMDWRNGEDVAVALVRMYGKDIADACNDPERQEEMAKANQEYMEMAAKEKDYEEQYQKNIDASLDEMVTLQEEMGLTDDQLDQAMGWLMSICKDAMLGKFSRETVMMAIKAQSYDTALADATHEAEVRGRNQKVTETLRKPRRSDGLAALGGKNSSGQKPDLPDFGALNNVGAADIWERGGEKRRKHNI